MQHLGYEDRLGVLGEVLMDEFKIIREYLEHVPTIKSKVVSIDTLLETVESDLKVVKAAVIDQSHMLRGYDKRIRLLEETLSV